MQSNEFRVLFISILTLSDTEHFTIDRKTWEVSVFKVEFVIRSEKCGDIKNYVFEISVFVLA